MKFFKMFLVLAFFSPLSALATKFAPMSMNQRVSKANLIVTAKIIAVQCLSPENTIIQAGKMCTAPGYKNRLKYRLETIEALFYRPHVSRDQQSPVVKEIVFSFTALSHWSVPRDQYESLTGKEMIFLLRENHNGDLAPIHEAFFTAAIEEKSEIERLLKARNKK